MLLIAAVVLTGCGGGSHFASHPRPVTPLNISVYINDQRISVSPSSVTPGPVAITITNQSSSAQSIEVAPAGGSAITTTGPISPQANDQVTVDVSNGQYTVGIAPNNSTQAASATPTGIVPGTLTVQGKRPNSNNQLLTP
jgi:hypothetical protein